LVGVGNFGNIRVEKKNYFAALVDLFLKFIAMFCLVFMPKCLILPLTLPQSDRVGSHITAVLRMSPYVVTLVR